MYFNLYLGTETIKIRIHTKMELFVERAIHHVAGIREVATAWMHSHTWSDRLRNSGLNIENHFKNWILILN